MSFGFDFDSSLDSIYNHVQEDLAHVAQYLPSDVTIPSFDDFVKDVASLGNLDSIVSKVPQIANPASVTLPQDSSFDFASIPQHVVEQNGDNWSTKVSDGHQDSSSHTGAGSHGWSNSGSYANAFPKAS